MHIRSRHYFVCQAVARRCAHKVKMKLIVTDLLGSFKKSVDTLVFPNKAKEENLYRAITFRWFVVPAVWRSLAWISGWLRIVHLAFG